MEDPLWGEIDAISSQIASYEATRLEGRIGLFGGLFFLILFLSGLAKLVTSRINPQRMLVMLWLGSCILTMLATPLGWQRYAIILVAPIAIIAGYGAAQLITYIGNSRNAIVN
jgi:asparagine N-glycosylation enzyme membrane subunit Stt3